MINIFIQRLLQLQKYYNKNGLNRSYSKDHREDIYGITQSQVQKALNWKNKK